MANTKRTTKKPAKPAKKPARKAPRKAKAAGITERGAAKILRVAMAGAPDLSAILAGVEPGKSRIVYMDLTPGAAEALNRRAADVQVFAGAHSRADLPPITGKPLDVEMPSYGAMAQQASPQPAILPGGVIDETQRLRQMINEAATTLSDLERDLQPVLPKEPSSIPEPVRDLPPCSSPLSLDVRDAYWMVNDLRVRIRALLNNLNL